MKIDGRAIANHILDNLQTHVSALKERGITPTLAVIQIGDDPGSNAYIRQKQKSAEQIGAKLILCHVSSITYQAELQKLIQKYNDDPSVHGIIVQRPLPKNLHAEQIRLSKDVDGFLPDSPYPVPVVSAVLTILGDRINSKKIAVIGRGETAGKPIADALIKRGYDLSIIHSQTPNPEEIIKTADIVISCVGRRHVVRRHNIKKGAILISVGLSRDSEGKLHGDYEEEEIKDVARLYTPTPGGVGPINVACLMVNLVKAANSLL